MWLLDLLKTENSYTNYNATQSMFHKGLLPLYAGDKEEEVEDKPAVIAASVTVVFILLLCSAVVVASFILWRVQIRRCVKRTATSSLPMLPSSAYLIPISPTSIPSTTVSPTLLYFLMHACGIYRYT